MTPTFVKHEKNVICIQRNTMHAHTYYNRKKPAGMLQLLEQVGQNEALWRRDSGDGDDRTAVPSLALFHVLQRRAPESGYISITLTYFVFMDTIFNCEED